MAGRLRYRCHVVPRPRPHVLQKRPADARSTAGAGDVIQWVKHPAHRVVIFDRHSCCFKASKLGNFGDFCSILFHISQSTAQFFSILWPKGDFFRLENCHVSSLKGTKGGQKHVHSYMLNESFPGIFIQPRFCPVSFPISSISI